MNQHDSCQSLELEAPGKPSWTAEASSTWQKPWLWADSSILGGFWWLDWLLRPWRYFTGIESAANYLIAGGAFWGATLFVIGSFADIAPPVHLSSVPGTGLHDPYAILVLLLFCIGTYLFTLSCVLLYVVENNHGYTEAVQRWTEHGRPGHRPWYTPVGLHPTSSRWWGGLTYATGAVMYNIGSTANLVSQFPDKQLTATQYKYLSVFTYTFGGGCFLLAGALYAWARQGYLTCYRGIFLPLIREDWTSIHWWVDWLNFYGGVGFCVASVFLNYLSIIPFHPTYQIESGIGFGAGSFCFWLAALLLLIQMSKPERSAQPALEVCGSSHSVPSSRSDVSLAALDSSSLLQE